MRLGAPSLRSLTRGWVVVPALGVLAGATAVASSGAAASRTSASGRPASSALAGPTGLASRAGQYLSGSGPIALTQPADPGLGRITPTATADRLGMFAPQVAWPLIPIHATLLPNGHVISYGTPVGVAEQNGTAYDDWDPALGTGAAAHHQVASMGTYNSFCDGLERLPDGDLLMVGGNSTTSSMVYSPGSGRETMGPTLNRQRWYASVLRLPDDRQLVLGGGDYYNGNAYQTPNDESGVATTPEIGSGTGAWSLLTGANSSIAFGAQDNRWWYPRAFNGPDGAVFGISYDQLWRLDPSGAGQVTGVGVLTTPIGVSGAAVMYAPGRILLAGGGQHANGDSVTATDASTLVDISSPGPVVTPVAAMAHRRNWLNLTVLPTGEVLANGGTVVGTAAGRSNAVYAAEIWNPQTRTWRSAAAAQRIRTYHSTSLLLPSGAVFTGGGGVPGPEDNLNAEIYYPPYLFHKGTDGVVRWVSRPQITSLAGAVGWGGRLSLGLADARRIGSFSLIALGTGTHGVTTDQRRVPLSFVQSGRSLTTTLPGSRDVLPPGPYLLQAVDAAGVPSPSQIVTVANTGAGKVSVFEPDRSVSAAAAGPGVFVGGTVPLAIGTRVSLEPAHQAGYRVRAVRATARVERVGPGSPPAVRADASFTVRPGLARGGVSLESVSHPGYYLVVVNRSVVLRRNDGTRAFAGAATFASATGLTGQNTSLRVVGARGYYLRRSGAALVAQRFDGTAAARRDATFSVRAAPLP